MANEITLNTVTDAIREKVRKVVLDSIPDGAVDALVKKEYDAFFKPDSYYNESAFSKMVKEQIKIQLTSAAESVVKTYLEKHKEELSGQEKKLIGGIVEEMAPFVLKGVAAEIANASLYQIKAKLNIY